MYKIGSKYQFRDHPYHSLWIYGDDAGSMFYSTDGYKERRAAIRYQQPNSTDRNSGGQYFKAIFPDGRKRRIYLKDLTEYR